MTRIMNRHNLFKKILSTDEQNSVRPNIKGLMKFW